MEVINQAIASTSGATTGGATAAQVTPATQAAAAPATTTTTAAAPVDWTSSLNPEAKLLVEKKQFKDPGMVLDSYKNLESLLGTKAENVLKLPDSFDSPEMSAVYDRLGRPKEASEYKFASPKTGAADPEFVKWAQENFHKAGLSKAQGEVIAAKWNEYAEGIVTKDTEAKTRALTADKAALNKEWGGAFEQEAKKAFRAAQTFGLGQDEITQMEKAIGYSKTMKFMAAIGNKLGEDGFVNGSEGGGFQGALTPDMANAQIAELKKDSDWVNRYTAGDVRAKQQLNRLLEYANPGLKIS